MLIIVSPNQYDALNPILISSVASSVSSGQLSTATTGTTLSNSLSSSDSSNGLTQSNSSTAYLLPDRPLPQIPLPTPPIQHHIIPPGDLIGFEDKEKLATKLGQVSLKMSLFYIYT